jgi:hypothetical protein
MIICVLVGFLMLRVSSVENFDFKNCCIWQHVMSVGNLSNLQCPEIFGGNFLGTFKILRDCLYIQRVFFFNKINAFTALLFTASGAPPVVKRTRILPMTQHADNIWNEGKLLPLFTDHRRC